MPELNREILRATRDAILELSSDPDVNSPADMLRVVNNRVTELNEINDAHKFLLNLRVILKNTFNWHSAPDCGPLDPSAADAALREVLKVVVSDADNFDLLKKVL